MANYNHEILVNYLRDVYSMELLVRKIEDDIHSTREDIQCEQALVEKVESTPIPAEGNISPKKDITPYMIAGFLILFISFGFFTLPSIGAISGILGIGVSIILFSCAGSVSSDNTKMQEEEKEKIKENFQRDVEEYEHMLALANDCRSVLPSQIDDYNAAVSHLQEAKEKLQSVYSVNIIPNKYRSVYVAYYLYDYISSSHETDIDRVLQTMLLEQIIAKLDKIIAQQEEIILNQRMQLAKQDALLAQSKKQHYGARGLCAGILCGRKAGHRPGVHLYAPDGPPAVHYLCHLPDDRLHHVPSYEPCGYPAVQGAQLWHMGAYLGLQLPYGALLADVLLRPAQPVYLPRYFPQTAASGKPGTALRQYRTLPAQTSSVPFLSCCIPSKTF